MKNQRGFTLIELSIVIAIIGLIVAWVTAGNSLVAATQLRSVMNDINKYKTEVASFRLQYQAVPSDISNAESYWGGVTVNGNGDGQISSITEGYRAWQHLNLAKLEPTPYRHSYLR